MTVSTDLENMLHDELGHLHEDRDRIDAKITAIHLLLETSDDMPAATFTADDAREHDTGKPSDPMKPKATRKSLRVPLDAREITAIREKAADGTSYQALADQYCVSRSTIGNVVQRKGCYE